MNGERIIEGLAVPLRRGAGFLEVVAIVAGVLGVIGGIALATSTQTTTSDLLYGSDSSSHPYVGAGLTLIAVAIVAGVFNWCVARALKLFATDVALRNGVTFEAPPAPVPSHDSAGWGGDPPPVV